MLTCLYVTIVQGLRLFNLDIIREYGTRDQYYVIDINYFPGKCFSFMNVKSVLRQSGSKYCAFLLLCCPYNFVYDFITVSHCRVWENAGI